MDRGDLSDTEWDLIGTLLPPERGRWARPAGDMRGFLPIIPPRSNRKVPVHPDYRRYKDRNRVERMFGKLKQQRRIATRYDKAVLSFESFLNLAVARLWLKSFVNTA